jgi:hypothetical protein
MNNDQLEESYNMSDKIAHTCETLLCQVVYMYDILVPFWFRKTKKKYILKTSS